MPPRGPDQPVSPAEIISSGLCIGCGACASSGAMQWDRYGQLKPQGPRAWRRTPNTGFSATCPFSPTAANEDMLAARRFPLAPNIHGLIGRYHACYVGYASEGEFRRQGSSGGMVSWVAAELLKQGLVDGVAHVVPGNVPGVPHFSYRISRSAEEVGAGAKSRYYPVHLADVLGQIRAMPGRYAIIGVPCFIKAVQLLQEGEPMLKERILFLLGLFCGHMKSARLIDSFAWQLGADPSSVKEVDYRLKNPDRPANWYTAQLGLTDGRRVWRDWWHLVDGDWGAGFFQNSACNFCDDVVAETADMAFGDAWVEPYSSDGRGTNVVIMRSPILHDLVCTGIADGRLELEQVDADFVVATQAAGFRQRREGLAYRLAWARRGLRPRKRVFPAFGGLPLRRRLVYRVRAAISRWSHRMAWLASHLHAPAIYTRWARLMLTFYQGITYSRGRVGWLSDRVLPIRHSASRIG